MGARRDKQIPFPQETPTKPEKVGWSSCCQVIVDALPSWDSLISRTPITCSNPVVPVD